MATLTGSLGLQQSILFIPLDNTAELIKGLDYATITANDGAYNLTIANGEYTVHIGSRVYTNVVINSNGSLNDFLEKANGGNL